MQDIPGLGKMILTHNDVIQGEILRTGNWESHQDVYYERFIKGGAAIDIGANIGVTTLKMAKYASVVHSFEPLFVNWTKLIQHIALNNLNAIPYHFALSDKQDITHYSWVIDGNYGAAGLEISSDKDAEFCQKISNFTQMHYKQVPIFTTTLDSLNIQNVDFIKIDTEGCEEKVLGGAIETIKKWRPVILLEINGSSKNDIFTFLNNLNYTVEHIGKTDYIALP